MSDHQKPNWDQQGFMGAPTQAPASNVTTGAPGDIGAMMRAPAPAKPARGYFRFELPESVKDSMHWAGTDADLVFGLWEPQHHEIRSMMKAEAEYEDEAKNYVAALGRLDQEGNIARDENGEPVAYPVTDNTAEVLPWWARLSPKAKALVVVKFVEMISPSIDEVKAVSKSKKWVR